MFEKRKAEQAAAEAATVKAGLEAMISTVEHGSAVTTPVMLKSGEAPVYVITGGGLFETRRGAGQWQGRSSGMSVPVGAGVRVRVGQSRGHFVQGAEAPTVIDTGTVTFTTRRVVFQGPRFTREWDFAKLVGIQHFSDQPWTAIQVSNRQKTSGFSYPGLRRDFVHARLEIAVGLYQGKKDEILRQLRDQLAELQPPPAPVALPANQHSEVTPGAVPAWAPPQAAALDTRATAPPVSWAPPSAENRDMRDAVSPRPPPPPDSVPAAWLPDPRGEHRLRWWDGTTWSANTAD